MTTRTATTHQNSETLPPPLLSKDYGVHGALGSTLSYCILSYHASCVAVWLLTPPGRKTNYHAVPSKNTFSSPSDRELAEPSSPSASSLKLEELSLGVLNKLHPGNLKRATSDFMKEWERSLGEPGIPIKDKAC